MGFFDDAMKGQGGQHEGLPESSFGPDGSSGYAIGRFFRNARGQIGFVAEGFLLWGDAQNALQRMVSPETAKQKGLVRTQEYEEGVPDSVVLAFDFIRHCNKVTAPVAVGARQYDGTTTVDEIKFPELHQRQEAALDIACKVIGSFLSEELPDDDRDSDSPDADA